LLNKKYIDDKKVHIYPNAVSNKNWKMNFYSNEIELFDQWATIVKECAEIEGWKNEKVSVDIVKLTQIINNDILPRHKKVHLLKLDIEGAEFDVINDIIDEQLYKNINYIVVETHERFFQNWKKMLKNIKTKIKENWITNIYLDWI
jgi:FkbM family methyltransferase